MNSDSSVNKPKPFDLVSMGIRSSGHHHKNAKPNKRQKAAPRVKFTLREPLFSFHPTDVFYRMPFKKSSIKINAAPAAMAEPLYWHAVT